MRKGIAIVLAAVVAVPAFAQEKVCETNYKQEGGFMSGRRFSTSETLADVKPADAYKRIYQGGVKSGLTVAQADKEMGIINFQQSGAGTTFGGNGQPVSIPWNVNIEEDGAGSKITVTKMTPPSYPTSADAQKTMLCGVIDEARNK